MSSINQSSPNLYQRLGLLLFFIRETSPKKCQKGMALPLFFEFVFAQRFRRDAVTSLIF
ncbi:hypothetical protein Enr17x_05960 [Gimesia fumaroli]|uniref:Uncharacterized protein n=1 Tax=Gimesia fumaroli TaxID=2527976 RepID=A0A518I675_9PLAN|nr:hypothetical protein Enr17x_05960 [Gimesia fumaroli]